MTSLEALRNICYECEKKMAINKTRCPFRSISNEFCEEYDLIKKDLEILEILKNESDSKRIIERDGIVSFHLDMILTSDNYNKIKEWLEK